MSEIGREIMRGRRSGRRLSFYNKTGCDIEKPLPAVSELNLSIDPELQTLLEEIESCRASLDEFKAKGGTLLADVEAELGEGWTGL